MTAVIKSYFDVRLLCWQMYLVMHDPLLVIIIIINKKVIKIIRNAVNN